MNRRQFIGSLGAAILAVKVVSPKVAHAQNPPVLDNGDVIVESGISRFVPLADHWHYLAVPLSALSNPPAEGLHLQTSRAYLHYHNVNLSQKDLMDIAQGQTVTVDDTVGDHQYAISLPPQK